MHCKSQMSSSKIYSQVHVDFSSDGDFHYSTFAIRSLFKCDIQDVQVTDFHPVQKSQFTLSFFLTATAGLLSLPALCWAFEPHRPCLWYHESPAQGLDSLHWMAWQTDDQTAVISLKTPRVNRCQSQNFFFFIRLISSCFTVLCKVQVWGFHGGSEGKESACNAGDPGLIPDLGRSLEKEMATHSSILA